MSLKEYWRKRDFKKTPEPKGKVEKEVKPIFVVQHHWARKEHWDFRLEDEGVLKSWAIPKEPPLEAGVKRLSIQTEDHPRAYASFEGRIPEGLYGAGKVKIWDKGELKLIEKTENKYAFELKGKKMKGKYFLTKFPQSGLKNWLLFKAKEKKKAIFKKKFSLA